MKDLLNKDKSFLVRFCVHCDKSLLKTSVTCIVVFNKQFTNVNFNSGAVMFAGL